MVTVDTSTPDLLATRPPPPPPPPLRGLLLETDTSGAVGIGAICGRRWLYGRWPQWLRDVDIEVQELVAVVVPINVWAETLSHRCVLVRSDNSRVVAAINSQSSRSPLAMRWLRHLILLTVGHNILIRALHVPGVHNVAADALCRDRPQVFRELRPDADCEPATWDWDAFATLQQWRHSHKQPWLRLRPAHTAIRGAVWGRSCHGRRRSHSSRSQQQKLWISSAPDSSPAVGLLLWPVTVQQSHTGIASAASRIPQWISVFESCWPAPGVTS